MGSECYSCDCPSRDQRAKRQVRFVGRAASGAEWKDCQADWVFFRVCQSRTTEGIVHAIAIGPTYQGRAETLGATMEAAALDSAAVMFGQSSGYIKQPFPRLDEKEPKLRESLTSVFFQRWRESPFLEPSEDTWNLNPLS